MSDARSTRRSRRRLPSFSDNRKQPRRLFGRSASSRATPATPAPGDDLAARRSFLAKPPAPGAARRVLTVLTTSQKRNASHGTKRGLSSGRVVQVSGYEEMPDFTQSPPYVVQERMSKGELVKSVHSDRKCVPDDEQESGKSDSVNSSEPSTYAIPAQRMLEVDASEVSDEANSNISRSARVHGVSDSPPMHAEEKEAPEVEGDELVFIDDVEPAGTLFKYVGEEEGEVPEAPLSVGRILPEGHTWEDYEDHMRSLRTELETTRAEKRNMEKAFTDENREMKILLQSLRGRAAESTSEVEELSRQLRDTRKRLNKRIRELEVEGAAQVVQFAEEAARHREVEASLCAELHSYREKGNFSDGLEGVPEVSARRERASVAAQPGSRLARHHNIRSSMQPVMGDYGHGVGSSPVNNQVAFGRVQSMGSVQESLRRKNTRSRVSAAQARQSIVASSGLDAGTASIRTNARRSLLRRAFIAHIHSNHYKTVRSVWYDFLGGEGGCCTAEQFARAVRGLAVAADARDRDLDALRQDVCGTEVRDTGMVTWAMFVRFYQRSRREST